MPTMPAALQPLKTAAFSAAAIRRAASSRGPGRRPRRHGRRRRSSERGDREGRPQLDQRQHAALTGLDPSPGARPTASTGRGWWPSTPSRAGPRSRRACGRRGGREALARLVVEQLPAGLGDRRLLAQQVAHPLLPRRPPIPSDSAAGERRAPRGRALGGLLLGLLAVLDDVALLEEDPLRRSRATAASAQQELEVHAEVLELLALGVAHDRRAPRGRARPPSAARTSRSPRPPRSATRRAGRRSASLRVAPSAGSWYWSNPTATSFQASATRVGRKPPAAPWPSPSSEVSRSDGRERSRSCRPAREA